MDRAEERDADLVRRVVQAADNLRMYLREWVQQELKDARIELQLLEPLAHGPLVGAIAERLARIEDVDRRELGEVDARFVERIREVEGGAYTDPTDARVYLDEGVAALERLVRELRQMRSFIVASQLSSRSDER